MRTDSFLAVAILGGGVKSFVMEPMARGGPLDRNWDFCVFTHVCPKRLSIYYHLDWPARELSSPQCVVSNGRGVLEDLKTLTHHPCSHGHLGIWLRVKRSSSKKDNIRRQQCTKSYKIRHTRRGIREILGLKR